MKEYIIREDLNYLRSQLLELEQYLAEDHDEMDPALIMLDDVIRHIEAYLEEDI